MEWLDDDGEEERATRKPQVRIGCDCGAMDCPSCGPAQGYEVVWWRGEWWERGDLEEALMEERGDED